jgi:anti-sigma factor RsiW
MSNELFNILSHSNKDIDNQKLMDYISGKLSEQEKHEVEELMADNELMNDAIEGLSNMKDKVNLQAYVDQLNQGLHKQLEEKKIRREKKRLQEYPWIYFTIVLILLLCIAAFLIIRQFLH